MPERRPHKRRPCPVPGCDWMQVTSWYVGGPGTVEAVSSKFLELEATSHMLTHAAPMKRVIDIRNPQKPSANPRR